MYDSITTKYWKQGVDEKGKVEEKLKLFDVREQGGVRHVTGELDPRFATYVEIARRAAGKDRQHIPLPTDDVERAKMYRSRGFSPTQEVVRTGLTRTKSGPAGYLMPEAQRETER